LKVKRILISQPAPETPKSPYFDLCEKFNVKIDFKPFIQVEPVSIKDFRQTRINIPDYTSLVFTSRTAIDHFFRICSELKVTVADTTKYFCISESIAFYLQKYIVYRKRKIFNGKNRFDELIEIIKRFPTEKYLVPLSQVHKQEIPNLLDKAKINYTKAILYNTVSSDMSEIKDIPYDVIVFFSPQGIESLKFNFPDFVQGDIAIGAFGPSTAKAVTNAGLRLDIQAPSPTAPSMPAALEQYIKKALKS
jgi:uroporphyrinogen-III synthase